MELLTGMRVRVASWGVAAAYAGWLLRRLGAEVDHESALDPEGIGAYLAEGATFRREPGLGAGAAPILITDARVCDTNRAALAELSRTSRVIWLTPWGSTGEWSERPASDLALYAAGGWMWGVGNPGREPLAAPGGQGQYAGGLFAAIAALGPAGGGRVTEAPGLTEIVLVEALTATTIYDTTSFQYYGVSRQRAGNRYSPAQATIATFPCKDGYTGIHAALHAQWATLANLVGHPELVNDPRFRTHTDRAAHTEELDSYLLPWLAERTRMEAYHELQQHRIPSSYIPDMAELLEWPHLHARGAWGEVTTPGGTRYQVPTALVRARDGGATASVGPAERPAERVWQPGRLRVVDLSMGWAGPMVGYVLGALGGDVIKVESHTHFDWWRGSRAPGSDPALSPHERSHVFNSVNRGKRGVTLNLATPRGNELARDLIATADVVIENFGAGVIEKLGLTYETLSADNPRLVMVRQPGFGSDGPEAGYLTFGNTIEGNSGLSSLTGYAGGPPMILSNALGDPISGLTGATAALAALRRRETTGRGCQVECAQIEGFLPLVSESLIEYQRTGTVPPRRGNARVGHTPSGAFRCAGDDRWVVLEVRSDEEWAALAGMIGEAWAIDGRYREEAGRAVNSEDLCRRIGGWTAQREREAVVETCLAAGVPSAMVCDEPDLLALAPLNERGFWVGQEREAVGFTLYPSLPIVTGGERLGTGRPAPLLGEHTVEVLTAMGFGERDLDQFVKAGVTGFEPVA